MIKYLFTILTILTGTRPCGAQSQENHPGEQKINVNDYVFYDAGGEVCSPQQAYWYRGMPRKEGKRYPFVGYYVSGQKYVYGFYSSLASGGIKDGYFLFYDTLGLVTREGVYQNNLMEGVWRSYHKGAEKVSREQEYRQGMLDGYFRYYDTAGQTIGEGFFQKNKPDSVWKRYRTGTGELWYEEVYNNGGKISLTSYYPGGRIKREEKYSGTGMMEKASGTCYDTSGREIGFTPFSVMPEFPGGMDQLQKFLTKNIHYPEECKDKLIQGRVIVRFTISVNGIIEDVQIARPVHPKLDAEAMRVIAAMPPWKPGIEDDIVAPVYYTLPVRFLLE